MKAKRTSRRVLRGNPFLRERVHDPLRARGKVRGATRCPVCGVQQRGGRWRWPVASSPGLKAATCPACRRIAADYPAGELVLAGDFLHRHQDEILANVRHVEAAEKAEHPLNRIMAIDERDGALVISTTDIYLPHRIAHALRDAWGGATRTHHDLGGYFTRVHWSRDD